MSTGCRMSVSSFSCRNRSSKSRKVSFAYCCVLMLEVYYTIRIVNRYSFLIETYSTERQKILGVWAMFKDEELPWRPHPRARSVHEQMVHQCVSEDHWMKNFLGIDLGEPPLPTLETKLEFIKKYAESSSTRMGRLEAKPESWFEDTAQFFDVHRSRAWILVRRIAHSAHHRGQLTTYLRALGHELYSTYGPTADTGGLFQDGARAIYQYPDIETLLVSEGRGGVRPPLPGPGSKPPTERPEPTPHGTCATPETLTTCRRSVSQSPRSNSGWFSAVTVWSVSVLC